MRLSELLREAGLCPAPPGNDPEINDIVSDSRQAHPGSLFVAIRGLHADGHAYLGEAAAGPVRLRRLWPATGQENFLCPPHAPMTRGQRLPASGTPSSGIQRRECG